FGDNRRFTAKDRPIARHARRLSHLRRRGGDFAADDRGSVRLPRRADHARRRRGRARSLQPALPASRADARRPDRSRSTIDEVREAVTEQRRQAQANDQRAGYLALYRQMLTIRFFEEKAIDLFSQGLIPGSTHPCIGQEAIAVGACAALRPDDLALATYRGHGVAIAKGSPTRNLMAELLTRVTGCSRGRGGSMHLCDVERGLLGTNAIVAAHIPIAGGVALASKLRGRPQVTACFFGDGAPCEREFFETLNMAALWRVPLILICENNGYAISVPTSLSQSTHHIADLAAGFGIPGAVVDGNDPLAVREAVETAAARARAGEGPTLVECET